MSETDEVIVEEMRACCKTARGLLADRAAPTRELGRLVRRGGALQPGYPEAGIDWWTFIPALTHVPGFWTRMRAAAANLRTDELVEGVVGFQRRDEERATVLWQEVLGPLMHFYGLRRPDWRWDRRVARATVRTWRKTFAREAANYRTLAPLDNLVATAAVRLAEGFVIRPLSDDDRQQLWRSFGAPNNPSSIAPTIEDLERWTAAVELRWQLAHRWDLTQELIEPAMKKIEGVICALRLQHPAVVGARIFWTRMEPPDLAVFRHGSQELLAARDASVRFTDRRHAPSVGPTHAKSLRTILSALESTSDQGLKLALRRFDSAYRRDEPEDALIFGWRLRRSCFQTERKS